MFVLLIFGIAFEGARESFNVCRNRLEAYATLKLHNVTFTAFQQFHRASLGTSPLRFAVPPHEVGVVLGFGIGLLRGRRPYPKAVQVKELLLR